MNYLTQSSGMARQLHLPLQVGLIFHRLRELPLGFRQCPAEMRGIFIPAFLRIVLPQR
jgi:hypothetical protein